MVNVMSIHLFSYTLVPTLRYVCMYMKIMSVRVRVRSWNKFRTKTVNARMKMRLILGKCRQCVFFSPSRPFFLSFFPSIRIELHYDIMRVCIQTKYSFRKCTQSPKCKFKITHTRCFLITSSTHTNTSVSYQL